MVMVTFVKNTYIVKERLLHNIANTAIGKECRSCTQTTVGRKFEKVVGGLDCNVLTKNAAILYKKKPRKLKFSLETQSHFAVTVVLPKGNRDYDEVSLVKPTGKSTFVHVRKAIRGALRRSNYFLGLVLALLFPQEDKHGQNNDLDHQENHCTRDQRVLFDTALG